MKSRTQQHIDIAIDHFVNYGPGYPVHIGGGVIEWHTGYDGQWRGVLGTYPDSVDAVMEALYKLCGANRWVINFMDEATSDPRDTWYDYELGVKWVQALRTLPDHPLASLYKLSYVTLS